MIASPYITEHARRRLRERLGLRRKAQERMLGRVLEYGLAADELEGDLRSFVDGVIDAHGIGHESRIYADSIWIIDEGRLVTVYRLPVALQGKAIRLSRAKRGAA